MKKVTMQQIGESLGVSKVAVFKALNDKPGIGSDLRAKVKEAAATLGYRPCNSKYKTNLNFIYAIKKSFFLFAGEQFYTTIYYYLVDECEKTDSALNILFYEDNDLVDTLQRAVRNLKNPVSGVFIAGGVDDKALKNIKDLSVPFVFIDFYSPLYPYDYVYLDNYNASFFAATTLIKRGHKKIGFVGNIRSTSAVCDRYLGYRKALIENNLPFENDFHIDENIEKDNDDAHIDLPKNMPSAFICHCDSAAHKLYLILKFHNFSIPGDVSVLSFDNTEICKTMSPPLSSVGTSKEKYAKRAIELMMEKINNTSKSGSCIMLRPTLSDRDSVKDFTTK